MSRPGGPDRRDTFLLPGNYSDQNCKCGTGLTRVWASLSAEVGKSSGRHSSSQKCSCPFNFFLTREVSYRGWEGRQTSQSFDQRPQHYKQLLTIFDLTKGFLSKWMTYLSFKPLIFLRRGCFAVELKLNNALWLDFRECFTLNYLLYH